MRVKLFHSHAGVVGGIPTGLWNPMNLFHVGGIEMQVCVLPVSHVAPDAHWVLSVQVAAQCPVDRHALVPVQDVDVPAPVVHLATQVEPTARREVNPLPHTAPDAHSVS